MPESFPGWVSKGLDDTYQHELRGLVEDHALKHVVVLNACRCIIKTWVCVFVCILLHYD